MGRMFADNQGIYTRNQRKSAESARSAFYNFDMRILLKITSISIIIAMLFPLSIEASTLLDTKTVGKLTMITILAITAFVTKILVQRDKETAAEIHEKLGDPDRSMEFREGFDHWRVEWYGDRVYIIRNGILHKQYQQHTEPVREER